MSQNFMGESLCGDSFYLDGDGAGRSDYLLGILGGGEILVLRRLASVTSVLRSHLMPRLLVSARREARWISAAAFLFLTA